MSKFLNNYQGPFTLFLVIVYAAIIYAGNIAAEKMLQIRKSKGPFSRN